MGDHSEGEGQDFAKYDHAIKCLSRIRCLEACVQHLNKDLSLPLVIGYVPRRMFMKSQSASDLPLFLHPGLSYKNCVRITSRHVVHVDGNIEYNKDGVWGRLIKITLDNKPVDLDHDEKFWLLLCNFNNTNTLFTFLVFCNEADDQIDESMAIESSWLAMTNRCFLPFGLQDEKAEKLISSSESYSKLNFPSWTITHDEQLCQLISSDVSKNIKNLVESIKVSSGDTSKENLLNSNNETWVPTNENSEHYIEIKLRRGIFVERLGLRLQAETMSYIVGSIVVSGGEHGNMEKLMERPNDTSYTYPGDEVWLLKKQKTYLKVIRVTFLQCRRNELTISGILLDAQKSEVDCYNFFNNSSISIYSKLHDVAPELLCKRSILLKRMMTVYDTCLSIIYPNWNVKEPSGIIKRISKNMDHLLPLSEYRMVLADIILEKSKVVEDANESPPTVRINRRITYKNPTDKLDHKTSVLYQIYSRIARSLKPFQMRFGAKKRMWWSCSFENEGISDQGGGFRDTLSNFADELCPYGADNDDIAEPVFSLFIASPNQRNPDANENDTFIPNGSCEKFDMYRWIGNVMGACFRTAENIAICLPRFFWKMFAGYEVTWKDYNSVDQKEVTDLSLMEQMDKAMFDDYFLDTRSWSHVLGNGSTIELKKDGENQMLQYENRLEYIKLAKEARLQEFKAQVDALRDGFLEVVPLSVLHLFTLEEFEERICGKPVVTLEDIKDNVIFKFSLEKKRVEQFWNVIEKLTDEERSRFLKFSTGRKRLPASIQVDLDETVDSLPTSTTCSSIFRYPNYSSFEKALSMTRYAINTCQTIDTDY